MYMDIRQKYWWKWDEIGMDFVVGLPKTQKGHDSIWVIVDRLTKSAHFIPVRTNYGGEKLAKLYVENIVKLHGVPSRIVSDRGTQFTSRFWKSLHQAMGTKLDFSSAYHPQTDGQTERVNQIMEDMLRACVLTYGKDWDRVCPMRNSRTIIVTKPAWACRHSKPSMGESAEPL
jgi:transposase InsO family protein